MLKTINNKLNKKVSALKTTKKTNHAVFLSVDTHFQSSR